MPVLDRNDKILVDESGHKQFLDELEKLKNKSFTIASSGNESYKDAVGDGWHDNFDFEESMRESRIIAQRINKMIQDQGRIHIIKKENLDSNVVNIDDHVKLKIIYDIDDVEIETIRLTGKYIPNELQEITLNSPLGRTIYKKKIGSINEYVVSDKIIKVRILEKYSL